MKQDWFGVLEASRELPRTGFTAPDLAKALGWKDGEKTASQMAAHWLYKFKRWGYVDVKGTQQSDGPKPLNLYVVTEKGRLCRPRPGRELQLRMLLEAVAIAKEARGKKAEAAALAKLFEVAQEIEKGLG